MAEDRQTITAAFDWRAPNYAKSEWHRAYAAQLVEAAPVRAGHRVLDAATGTGFAAIALARRVDSSGRVIGVDLSAGMLAQARAAIRAAGLGHVVLVQGDAAEHPPFAASTFDAVMCSAGLLYMPFASALREWRRLLVSGGFVGFSTMRGGFPMPGRLFRDCAAEYGLRLPDPSAPLGSEAAATAALSAAGFTDITIVPGSVTLSPSDLAMAWESNLRSAAHSPVRELSAADQTRMRGRYLAALDAARLADPSLVARAEVLYAFGRRGRTDAPSADERDVSADA